MPGENNVPALLEGQFKMAADFLASCVLGGDSRFNETAKLALYGLYKQATVGPCSTGKPGFWDLQGRAKWSAWSQLGATPVDAAMTRYVAAVVHTAPELQANLDRVAAAAASGKMDLDITDDGSDGVDLDHLSSDDERDREEAQRRRRERLAAGAGGGAPDLEQEGSGGDGGGGCRNAATSTPAPRGGFGPVFSRMGEDQSSSSASGGDGKVSLQELLGRGDTAAAAEVLAGAAGQVDDADADGCTALHFAADRGQADVVRLLIGTGADVNARDADGQTPLHFAALCGHKDVFDLLVAAGADPTAADGEGTSAARLAQNNGWAGAP